MLRRDDYLMIDAQHRQGPDQVDIAAELGVHANKVRRPFVRKIKRSRQEIRRSMIHDRREGMAEHQLLAREAPIEIYFAHPNSAWERGANKSTKGLIRQHFPKSTDFNQVPRREIRQVQDLLNNHPRAALDYLELNDVYEPLTRWDPGTTTPLPL